MIADVPQSVLALVTSRDDDPAVQSARADGAPDTSMRALIGAARAQGYDNTYITDALDRRIRRYLAAVGHRGEGDRDNTAYRVARWLLNDFGASDAVTWAYLVEWNTGNTPPLPERQLQLKMSSAKRSGRRPAGCAHVRRGSAA